MGMKIKTWVNHVGTFAEHPITGAHYGPFLDVDTAIAEMLLMLLNGE
jgi:hypothetical protein